MDKIEPREEGERSTGFPLCPSGILCGEPSSRLSPSRAPFTRSLRDRAQVFGSWSQNLRHFEGNYSTFFHYYPPHFPDELSNNT